jgi:hypothetical protein
LKSAPRLGARTLKSSIEERRFPMGRLKSFGLGLAAMAIKRLVAMGLAFPVRFRPGA